MFLLDLLAAIGSVVLKIFSGRTGKVVSYLEPLTSGLIKVLENAEMSGTDKAALALETLTNFAIASGADAADHAINLAIEWEVAEGRGKNIKKIFKEGLEDARQVVREVGQLAINSDMGKKLEAAEILRMRLTHAMKNWLADDRNNLYLLIEAAVAETKEG